MSRAQTMEPDGPPGPDPGRPGNGADGWWLVFEANPLPMWIQDSATGRLLAVNRAAADSYGYSPAELLTKTADELTAAGIGSMLEIEASSVAITHRGRPARVVTARDVSRELELTAALNQAHEQFQSVIDQASVARVALTGDGRVSHINEAFCQLTGRAPTSLLGTPFPELVSDDGALRDRLAEVASGAAQTFHCSGTLVRAGGRTVPVLISGAAMCDEDGARSVCLLVQPPAAARLTIPPPPGGGLTDPLTGLPNRPVFLDLLDKALHRARRTRGAVGVLLIDLDRFDQLNATLGHAGGDQALLTVTRRVCEILSRRGDTVARFGGDELVVLCEDLPGPVAGLAVAERLREGLREPVTIDGVPRAVPVSIGVAVAGAGDNVTGEFLLHGADWAMYQAKQHGRDRCELFDPDSRARFMARMEQADDLRRGISAGELRAYYQPIVRLHDSSAPDMEALVRWDHPERGLVLPGEFIAMAEETGLIVAIGTWVIERACRDAAALDTNGAEPVGVSVNLSARQLARGELLDIVRDALHASGLEPRRLCLEITETVLMDDLEWSIEALLALKTLGVRLAIDDFGTGYSSLNYLRRLPVDVVKIDRSFVSGIGLDPAADAIVTAVVNLAHALGLSVVAEGVEREEQLVALRALGCDRAQGFLWSPPVPLPELSQALKTWAARVDNRLVDVRSILADRASAVRATAGRNVMLRASNRLPSALADPGALRTVLDQLLGNAVGFSTAPSPVVVAASADRRGVRITVSDFGVGMTPDQVDRCFEPFWQGTNGRGDRSGTGIGLYIVRSLVEKMGGRVWARSSPGRGSSFTFVLPRSAAAARPLPEGERWENGEPTVIHEFMRQLNVPQGRAAGQGRQA